MKEWKMRSKDIANLTDDDILFCEMVNEGKAKASEIEYLLYDSRLDRHHDWYEEWFMNPKRSEIPPAEEGWENWYPDHEETPDCKWGDPWCGCSIVDEDYDWDVEYEN